MIIIINGSVGVGKSTVAETLQEKFDKAIYLKGDQIGNVHPFEIYDEQRIDHLYRTLALLIAFHQENGYQNFTIDYVFESPESLQALLSLLQPLDEAIHTYWLTCNPTQQEKRIHARQRNDLDWELNRFSELNQIQAEAAKQGFIGVEVKTSQLSAADVADKIWQDIHGSN